MPESENRKRTRRSPRERAAEVDKQIETYKITIKTQEEKITVLEAKIESIKEKIAALETKKESILHPVPHLSNAGELKLIISTVLERGMSNEEIARRLDVDLHE